jgi:multiple sugar transport system permease protein
LPGRWLLYVALLLGAAIMSFPFYWMIVTSFKTLVEALLFPPTLWPQEGHPENYLTAWRLAPFARYFANTIFMAVAQVAGVLITSTLAAYAFARVNFAGKNLVFVLFLATLMVPFEVTLVPNFII